jgi:hypothetical protein
MSVLQVRPDLIFVGQVHGKSVAVPSEVKAAIGSGIEVEWVSTEANDGDTGIVAVEVETSSGKVRLD